MTNFVFNKIKNFIESTAFEKQNHTIAIKCIQFDDKEINFSYLDNLSKSADFEKNLNLIFESTIKNIDHFYDVKLNIIFALAEHFDKEIYSRLLIDFIYKIFKIEKFGLPSKCFVTTLELLLEGKFFKKDFWINLWNNSNPQCKYIYYCALRDESLFEEVLIENNSVIFIDRLIKEDIYKIDYVHEKIKNLISLNNNLSEKLKFEYLEYKANASVANFSTRAFEIV